MAIEKIEIRHEDLPKKRDPFWRQRLGRDRAFEDKKKEEERKKGRKKVEREQEG
ncbi:hypothetical protein HQ520_01290 [bacterium]|nr:hypothetical protein [bacterium]